MNAPAEEWRTISAFPIYAVSSLGRVKRIAPDARGHRVTGNCLKAVASKGREYLSVTLCRDGEKVNCRVNRLVCEAFQGPAPTVAHHAAHNDGNPANNCADNLRWATPVANNADKIEHGTAGIGDRHWSRRRPECRAKGEGHGLAKLTPDKVRAIRADGRGQRAIAADFGVSQGTVWHVKNRSTWRHVQ